MAATTITRKLECPERAQVGPLAVPRMFLENKSRPSKGPLTCGYSVGDTGFESYSGLTGDTGHETTIAV